MIAKWKEETKYNQVLNYKKKNYIPNNILLRKKLKNQYLNKLTL